MRGFHLLHRSVRNRGEGQPGALTKTTSQPNNRWLVATPPPIHDQSEQCAMCAVLRTVNALFVRALREHDDLAGVFLVDVISDFFSVLYFRTICHTS